MKETSPEDEDFLSTPKAARYLNKGEEFLRRKRREGVYVPDFRDESGIWYYSINNLNMIKKELKAKRR